MCMNMYHQPVINEHLTNKKDRKMEFQNLNRKEIVNKLRDDVVGGFDEFTNGNSDIETNIQKEFFTLNIPPYLLNQFSNFPVNENVVITFYTDYEHDYSDYKYDLYCLENNIPIEDNHIFIKDIEVNHSNQLEILNAFLRLYTEFYKRSV